MSQDNNDATRVMTAAPPPIDRTMVATAPPAAGATQMGQTITCAVCNSNNPALEQYCVECGFLLSSALGAAAEPSDGAGAPADEYALVENNSGRRFLLKQGENVVGREHADILLMDGTVSRRHAQVTLSNGAVTVTDLGSTNGSQVNGTPLSANSSTAVNPGATVRFGNSTLTLSAPGAPAEATIAIGTPKAEETFEQTLAVQVAAPPEAVTEDSVLAAPSATVPLEASAEPEAAPLAAEGGLPAIAYLNPTDTSQQPIALKAGTTTIGRRAGNDVVISTDPYVSGRHADVLCDDTGCYLTDVGSTNGSMVNGKKLEAGQREMLLDGDEVALGQTTLKFEMSAITAEHEEEPADEAPAIGFSPLPAGEPA